MPHPCLSCGACCATYRVALHWSEADPALGGTVPVELTEPLRRHELAMRGTSAGRPRCVALEAEIGVRSRCGIHPRRPSACREVQASWESGAPSPQCDRARLAHGLAPLTPADWEWATPANDEGAPHGGTDDNGNAPPAPPPIAA
jgi:hypothetical protein